MSVKDVLNKALKIPKKHHPKRAVKSLVARNFYIDGNLFIESFDCSNNIHSMQNRNFRAKAVVSLAMSIECSLKAIIISLSLDSESPTNAYKTSRGLSHNLEKLYNEVIVRAKKRVKLPKNNNQVFNDLKDLKVSSRYSFEVWLLRSQSPNKKFYLGQDIISKTIDSFEWLSKVRSEAVVLNNFANKCYKKYLDKHSILSGSKFKTYDAELKNFISSL